MAGTLLRRVAERPERLVALGQAYAAVYDRLWDEDEAMMRERERARAARPDRRERVDRDHLYQAYGVISALLALLDEGWRLPD